MSESSTKTSVKKGFTAPVLKGNLTNEIEHGGTKENKLRQEKSKKLNKKVVVKKHNPDENKENHEISGKPKQKKKPETSLSNSQYEDIFSAVLSVQKSSSNSQNNTEEMDHSFEQPKENTPSSIMKEGKERPQKRAMSEEVLPPATPVKQQKKADTKTPPSSHKALSELSPWGSHFNKQHSQSSSILKEIQESQSSLQLCMMSSDSSSSSDEKDSREDNDEEEVEELSQSRSCRQLSQVSVFSSEGGKVATNQRRRLEELQGHRNVGVWVYCCRQSCQKQRYLANITDPQDVPDIWYCHMNPDTKYNDCQCEEQKVSAEEEADMIYNQFTAGSLVWARVDGYPWWPAMVDDDPDLEQYYWLADDNMTVTYYHVVFFDETSVTRAWVNLKNIAPYTKNGTKYKQRMARGIDYSRRIMVAKEQSDDAVSLSTVQRLKIYSFIARFKGHITTSASQAKKTMTKYKLKVKTLKKSEKQVNVQKERKENGVVFNENKERKEKKRVKELDDTQCNSSRSGITKSEKKKQLGKRKKNEDEHKKKSKKPKTMFEKKADCMLNKKGNKDKINTKDFVKSDLKSRINSSNTEKNLNQRKKQKDSSKVEVNKTSKKEGLENAPDKIDNNTSKEVDKVIEETVIDDTEKDNDSLKEPPIVLNTQTDKESEQDSRLAKFVEEDVTNFDENKLTSVKQPESETPSGLEFNLNLSQKSKSSDRRNLPGPCVHNIDDTVCGLIQPSQESKHSQSTIADFFAVHSEDAVVPDADILSQLSSQPFEE